MPEFATAKLKLLGPIREIPKASTLFGAIGNAISAILGGDEVEGLVEAFRGGARISSAFPFTEDEYYLPKPLSVEPVLNGILTELGEKESYIKAKRLRKAKYLDIENFEKAIHLLPFEAPDELPFSRVDMPKVLLDRVTGSSSLYFWDEIRFEMDSGVYFLYSGPERAFRRYIEPALRYLADTGIGGKSTWGSGLFEVSFGRVRINSPKSEYMVTLSNTLPSEKPVLWRIFRRGGWSAGKRKPKMTFIEEGSVIRNDPGRIEELDIGLSYPIYVYGLSFPVPTKVPEGLE
ncbi:type III-A CRISPR-associated RAMP protein Csm4 [Thermococcus sp.]